MCRKTWVKYYSWGKEPSWEYTEGIYGWREHLATRKNRSSVCCASSQVKTHNSGHMTSQRTLWLRPCCSVRSLPEHLWDICHLLTGHCTEPSWDAQVPGTHSCPVRTGRETHICFLPCLWCQWGKWDLFPTPILTGCCNLRFVFFSIYIL